MLARFLLPRAMKAGYVWGGGGNIWPVLLVDATNWSYGKQLTVFLQCWVNLSTITFPKHKYWCREDSFILLTSVQVFSWCWCWWCSNFEVFRRWPTWKLLAQLSNGAELPGSNPSPYRGNENLLSDGNKMEVESWKLLYEALVRWFWLAFSSVGVRSDANSIWRKSTHKHLWCTRGMTYVCHLWQVEPKLLI